MKRMDETPLRVIAPSAWLFETPQPESRVSSELLFGEAVHVLSQEEDMVHVAAQRDGYRGWVHTDALAAPAKASPTHQITTPSALVYPVPDFHVAPAFSLPINAQLRLNGDPTDGFASLEGGHFVPSQHVGVGHADQKPIDIAQHFIGSPYAWGGRTARGIDCSGLVQQCLWACGQESPRDSGDQWRTLGTKLADGDTPVHGDLVFFPGHVGFYMEGGYLLHANATHMRCTVDPLTDVISWVAKDHSDPLTGFKRL